MWHMQGRQGRAGHEEDDQPDAADPVFSKDGRFLYFSARDARYKYDRNVNEGIWQIKRLDRRTGQVVPVTGEFGGARDAGLLARRQVDGVRPPRSAPRRCSR